MHQNIRVWDLPTRIFHWLLVACVLGLVVTGQLGGSAMTWHFRFGYAVLTLLLFRIVWGFVGGYWSRFGSFLYTPAAILRYLRGNAPASAGVGHNPLGAYSVFAMLLFLLLQVATGLISDDEIATAGPLTHLVPSAWVSLATWYHKAVGKTVLIVLVSVHILAVLYYLWGKRSNLIAPMLKGDKTLASPVQPSVDNARTRWLALVLALACAGAVATMLALASPF